MFRICLLLAGILAAMPAATASAQRVTQGTRIDTTIAFDHNGRVDLYLISGEIVVNTWDRAEARVVASIEDDGRLEYRLTRGIISIRTQTDEGDNRRGRYRIGEARYELTVPAGARVSAAGISGDVSISGTSAEVEAGSVSGSVAVENVRARVNANSVSGEVRVRNITGDTRVNAVSGDVSVQNVTGSVRVNTVSGDCVLSGVRSADVETQSVSGDMEFAGAIDPSGRYEFSTHSGDLLLSLPAPANAMFSLRSFSGEMDSDFPLTLGGSPATARERGTRRMEFTLGSGGAARITAETFSGDITLKRASARDDNQE